MKIAEIIQEELEYLESKRTERETNAFANMFLKPVFNVKSDQIWDFLRKYGEEDFQKLHIDQDTIRRFIRGMDYGLFLKTIYWGAAATLVKEQARYRCSACGRKTRILQVHHLIYDNHGDELHHTEDLVCLCEKCHKKAHKKF